MLLQKLMAFGCKISQAHSNRIKFSTLNNLQIIRVLSTKISTDLKEEIYVGKLTRRVKFVKKLTLMTSSLVFWMPFVLFREYPKMDNSHVSLLIGSYGMIAFLALCTPLIIHSITRKYVMRILHDPVADTYTSITYSLFLREKPVTFTVNDVERKSEALFTSILVTPKKIPLFIEAESFTDINHYKRIMGYDKPIDFELENPE